MFSFLAVKSNISVLVSSSHISSRHKEGLEIDEVFDFGGHSSVHAIEQSQIHVLCHLSS